MEIQGPRFGRRAWVLALLCGWGWAVAAGAEAEEVAAIKALFPDKLGAYSRSDLDGQSLKQGDLEVVTVQAVYQLAQDEEKTVEIQVSRYSNLNSREAWAGMHAWLNTEMSLENEAGTQKTGKFGDYPGFFTQTKEPVESVIMFLAAGRYLVVIRAPGLKLEALQELLQAVDWTRLAAGK